jgi:hypothetical protein
MITNPSPFRPCPVCQQPLRPLKNEYGDTVLRRGCVVSKCRHGHQSTAIPRIQRVAVETSGQVAA